MHGTWTIKTAPDESELILEEKYDIERARKRMSLLGPRCLLDKDSGGSATGSLTDIFSFDLQEINHGVQNGSGTGSMSWDSSIVMGLYFGRNPNELRGSVLELGSGVGLGGILSNATRSIVRGDDSVVGTTTTTSAGGSGRVHMTLSDVSGDVLDMLRRNMDSVARSSLNNFACFEDQPSIEKLDWSDFLRGTPSSPASHARYDTIIASDCAYLKSQVEPLSETISTLLGNTAGGHERLHVFAPHNRSAIWGLIDGLHERQMETRVEYIDMSKYRIKQQQHGWRDDDDGCLSLERRCWNDGQVSPDTVCGVSKFIHITAWHRCSGPHHPVDTASSGKGCCNNDMSDID